MACQPVRCSSTLFSDSASNVSRTVTTLAMASGEGQSVLGGQRNPTLSPSRTYSGETQIIASNATYGTRQSNKGTGGGAIYGCRAVAGSSASCVRAVNLNQGTAFDFVTSGTQGGRINAAVGGSPSATTSRWLAPDATRCSPCRR